MARPASEPGRSGYLQVRANGVDVAGDDGVQIALILVLPSGEPFRFARGRVFQDSALVICRFRTDSLGIVNWQYSELPIPPFSIDQLYLEMTPDGPLGSGPYNVVTVRIPDSCLRTPFDAGVLIVNPRDEIVRGRVILPGGEPAIESEVLLYEMVAPGSWQVAQVVGKGISGWTLCNKNGEFVLYGKCGAQAYRAVASYPGFVKKSTVGLVCGGPPVVLILEEGSILRGGALLDTNVPNELIHVQILDSTGVVLARTSLNGEYMFGHAGLPSGEVTVVYTLGLDGPLIGSVDVVSLDGGSDQSVPTLDLSGQLYTWTINISDEEGRPINSQMAFRCTGERTYRTHWASDRRSAILVSTQPGPLRIDLVSDQYLRLPVILTSQKGEVSVELIRK
jgi:hypothetical protein